jgi:hypothetical protein
LNRRSRRAHRRRAAHHDKAVVDVEAPRACALARVTAHAADIASESQLRLGRVGKLHEPRAGPVASKRRTVAGVQQHVHQRVARRHRRRADSIVARTDASDDVSQTTPIEAEQRRQRAAQLRQPGIALDNNARATIAHLVLYTARLQSPNDKRRRRRREQPMPPDRRPTVRERKTAQLEKRALVATNDDARRRNADRRRIDAVARQREEANARRLGQCARFRLAKRRLGAVDASVHVVFGRRKHRDAGRRATGAGGVVRPNGVLASLRKLDEWLSLSLVDNEATRLSIDEALRARIVAGDAQSAPIEHFARGRQANMTEHVVERQETTVGENLVVGGRKAERIGDGDALAEQRHEALDVERADLGDNVFDETVEQHGGILDVLVRIGRELAEAVKDLVEERENAAARNLGDIVKRLACIVARAHVLVCKAPHHWRQQLLHILARRAAETNGDGGKRNQAAFFRVAVGRLNKIVVELLDDVQNANLQGVV